MKQNNKYIFAVTAVLLIASTTHAEVFIGPSSSSNRLTIASGEAIIVSSVFGDSFGIQSAWIVSGRTNTFTMARTRSISSYQTSALKGPGELALLDSNSGVSFKRILGDAIQTVVVTQGQSFSLSVPAGKNLKFFHSFQDDSFSGRGNISGTISNSVSSVFADLAGAEISGPVTFSLPGQYSLSFPLIIFSYYFTDELLVLPTTGYIRGPTGSFEIAVEKSGDLTNWTTVAVQNTGSDSVAFYRLRLTK